MSQLSGNVINNYGINANNPISGLMGNVLLLFGAARITSAAQATQLVIPVTLRTNQQGRQDAAMIIPDGAFVYSVAWKIPAPLVSPSENTLTAGRGVSGTSTDLVKLNTAGFTSQGLTGSAANSFGGVSDAFTATTYLAAANYNKTYSKYINQYDNAAAAVAGLSLFTAGSFSDAQRTVNLYSVDSTAIAAGSGLTYSGVSAGFGYSPDFIDIPVVVSCFLPPVCPDALEFALTVNNLPLP